jgi:hypothetical protein
MTNGWRTAFVAAVTAAAGFAAGYNFASKPTKIAELDNGLKKVCEYSASSLQTILQDGWPINSFAAWEPDGHVHYHVLSQLGNIKCAYDPELTILYLQNHGLIEVGDLGRLLDDSRKAGDRRLADYLSVALQTK